MKNRYSTEDKKRFFALLEAYREALRTKTNIVRASIQIHAALGRVPKSFKGYINHAFSKAGQ